MRRNEAIELLRGHRTELHRLGVARLFLYGSVARDAADEKSDVDLLVEPENERFSLFDLLRVQDECTRLLGRAAELHDYRGLERAPGFRARVNADLVNVF
jgi:predicted nucleotidyltransferase